MIVKALKIENPDHVKVKTIFEKSKSKEKTSHEYKYLIITNLNISSSNETQPREQLDIRKRLCIPIRFILTPTKNLKIMKIGAGQNK